MHGTAFPPRSKFAPYSIAFFAKLKYNKLNWLFSAHYGSLSFFRCPTGYFYFSKKGAYIWISVIRCF